MNVKPVATPGLVPASQTTHGEAPRASTGSSTSDRGPALQRQTQATAAPQTNKTVPAAGQAVEVSSEDRQKAEQLRAFVNNDDLRVSTRHDDASGRNIVEILDQASGEVVSQYPTEEIIRLYASLRQSLVDKSA